MTFSDLVPSREFAGEGKTGFEPSRTKFRCLECCEGVKVDYFTCDRDERGGQRARGGGVNVLWCALWWRAHGDHEHGVRVHGPFCDDGLLCGDRPLRALCAPRDGDGQQLRGALQHGDGDRV